MQSNKRTLNSMEKERSLWSDAWRRLRKNTFAMVGLLILTIVALLAIFADVVAPHDPNLQDYMAAMKSPGRDHWLGTDNFGRDILSRIIYGGQISLRLGVLGTLIGASIGSVLGAVAGFFGGWVDTLIMRVLDIQMAFPGILLAIIVIAIMGDSEINVILAIGVFSLPTFARVIRGTFLVLREQDYVLAARSVGADSSRILFRHLLPNSLSPILVLSTIRLGTAILTAASLGFLGLGVRPPSPEWGTMLSEGRSYMQLAPHIAIFPGLAILITVVGLNLLGDGLRDALDPRSIK